MPEPKEIERRVRSREIEADLSKATELKLKGYNDDPELVPISDEDWEYYAGANRFQNGGRPLIGKISLNDQLAFIVIGRTGCTVEVPIEPESIVYVINELDLPNAEYAKGYFHKIVTDGDLKARDLIAFDFIESHDVRDRVNL